LIKLGGNLLKSKKEEKKIGIKNGSKVEEEKEEMVLEVSEKKPNIQNTNILMKKLNLGSYFKKFYFSWRFWIIFYIAFLIVYVLLNYLPLIKASNSQELFPLINNNLLLTSFSYIRYVCFIIPVILATKYFYDRFLKKKENFEKQFKIKEESYNEIHKRIGQFGISLFLFILALSLYIRSYKSLIQNYVDVFVEYGPSFNWKSYLLNFLSLFYYLVRISSGVIYHYTLFISLLILLQIGRYFINASNKLKQKENFFEKKVENIRILTSEDDGTGGLTDIENHLLAISMFITIICVLFISIALISTFIFEGKTAFVEQLGDIGTFLEKSRYMFFYVTLPFVAFVFVYLIPQLNFHDFLVKYKKEKLQPLLMEKNKLVLNTRKKFVVSNENKSSTLPKDSKKQNDLEFYNKFITEIEKIKTWTFSWKKLITGITSTFIPAIIFFIEKFVAFLT